MAFQFSDRHIEEYHTHGYTVFRGILPPSLIADLRRVTDRARPIAREKRGPQAQRLQPVAAYDLDPKPFEAFRDLPELCDAVTRVLSPRHTHGTREYLGVLFEPAELPYCTPWHRDWRDNIPGLEVARWEAVSRDPRYFNQLNCALYKDDCTWVVPGSHLRADLPREVARFPTRPIPGPELEGKSCEERERLCLEYCQSMPGAVRLHLDAGDFALYRNTLWHLGSYLPYCKRATLHDVVDTPEYVAWREETREQLARTRRAGSGNA
jgi:ectoine hydroxylase-related dioxygenase (phytanoyl-CoA dioxygenase family)